MEKLSKLAKLKENLLENQDSLAPFLYLILLYRREAMLMRYGG